jgi:hypothetical protein
LWDDITSLVPGLKIAGDIGGAAVGGVTGLVDTVEGWLT